MTTMADWLLDALARSGARRYGGEVVCVSDDAEITRVRLERPPRSPYGRLELVDRYGRKAWTNPLWG